VKLNFAPAFVAKCRTETNALVGATWEATTGAMRRGHTAAACLALLAPAALAAQTDGQVKPEARPDIVVSGRATKLDPVEVARQARTVTRDGDFRYEPLARFEGKVCPGVIGLTQAAAEYVVGRVRQVAQDLKLPLAKNGACSANLIIAFTEDGRADLAALQKRRNSLSEALTPGERRELLEYPGPARVFTITETRMENGSIVPRSHQLANDVSQLPVGRMEGGQSLIVTGSHREIVSVVVLFDRDKVRPLTLKQVADYSVMRGLARTRDATGEDTLDSILTLFRDGNAASPSGLTDFDRAYLQALYEGHANVKGASKLLRVAHKLETLKPADE
jgi:hypothetical protein